MEGIEGEEGKFHFYVFKGREGNKKIQAGVEGISCYGTLDSLTQTFTDISVSAVKVG